MKRRQTSLKSVIYVLLMLTGMGLTGQTPPDISLIFYLEEHSRNGTLVGTVTATDPDGDALTYSIISGNDNNVFAIGSSSGDITVANETFLDFEVTTSFVLMVEADDGNGGMTSAQVTINLVNILGLDDGDDRITIYPNPVVDRLFINLDDLNADDVELIIYSVDGRGMSITPVLRSDYKMEIDCRKLDAGLYILRMTDNYKNVLQRRFFVN